MSRKGDAGRRELEGRHKRLITERANAIGHIHPLNSTGNTAQGRYNGAFKPRFKCRFSWSESAQLIVRNQHLCPLWRCPFRADGVGGFHLTESEALEGFPHAFDIV